MDVGMRNFDERRKPYLGGVEDGLLAKPVPVGTLPAGLPGVDDGDVAPMHVSFIEVPKSTIVEENPALPGPLSSPPTRMKCVPVRTLTIQLKPVPWPSTAAMPEWVIGNDCPPGMTPTN
jgi:hypothetical protein